MSSLLAVFSPLISLSVLESSRCLWRFSHTYNKTFPLIIHQLCHQFINLGGDTRTQEVDAVELQGLGHLWPQSKQFKATLESIRLC